MASLCLKWVQYLSYIDNIKLVDGLVLSVLWLSAGMALDKLIMNNFPSLNGKIEIHDSRCNLRYQAINIFLKIFCRINPLGPDNILKMTSSQYNETTLAPWSLQPWATRLLSNRLFRLTTKQTQRLRITAFCENNLSPVVSHKWFGNSGISIDIMTVTQHIVAQYGDLNLATLTRVMACCPGLLPDGTIPLPEPVLTYHR